MALEGLAVRLKVEALEVSPELIRQVRASEGELHRGLEEAQLLAGVVTLPLEFHRIDEAAAAQGAEAVGELDLAAGIGRGILKDREDVGRQDVAADDGEVGGGVAGIGLLDQILDLVDVAAQAPWRETP